MNKNVWVQIETVPEEEVKEKAGVPHKEIIFGDKSTTRLRVVYDASARCNGISLNQVHVPNFGGLSGSEDQGFP